MESDATSRSAAPPPADWRALSRLRERVEDAVREIERLRSQNAALARRVTELQDQLGDEGGVRLHESDPEALRTRIQGFIDAIDDVLRTEAEAPETVEPTEDEDEPRDAAVGP